MKIATWNVNSIKVRMPAVTKWLAKEAPDVLCMQEIKTVDDGFPSAEFEAMGYNVAVHGQKSYNGVAILSKQPFEEVTQGLPGEDSDEQARYLECVIMGKDAPVRVASIYLPNGNPVMEDGAPTEKYAYKLRWLARLKARAESLLPLEEAMVLSGDYNVIPESKDVYDPIGWTGDAAFRPETHAAFQALLNIGLTEAFEQVDGRAEQYSFWDYQAGAWPRNHGIRIDHLLLSPQAADRITSLTIDRNERDGIKPSDHVPVIGTFDL
ncbi:MAG: exodeoxyribonuclease III [Alphaproteobacteria bacterium]